MYSCIDRIRVIIIDDHPIALAGLRLGLKQLTDIDIVGEALDGPTGLNLVLERKPDVAVIDILLPGMDGLEVAARVPAVSANTRVILMSGDFGVVARSRAARIGVCGIYNKTDRAEQLGLLIRSAVKGESRLENEPPPTRGDITRLNDKERQVLAHIAQGASLKELAQIMGLTYKSADYLKQRVMNKLDIHDRVELTRFAMQERLVG